MKCCCDKIFNLGCFSNCEVIKIEFETEADVAYKLYINANGRESFFNINSVDGGIEIDTSMLNESAISILSLYKADNEQVLFGEYDCLQLSISVVQGMSSNGGGGGGGLQPCNGIPLCSIQAGDNITIDNTNPQSPIISSTGGGGIPDAPSDGKLYGRENGAWQEVIGGDFNLEIGTPIDNSTAKSILFVDKDENLGEIVNFQYDEDAESLSFLNGDGKGLLLNTEIDDSVFANLNGFVNMVNGELESYIGLFDLSIQNPAWGEGVLIYSDNEVFITSNGQVLINSDSEVVIFSNNQIGIGVEDAFMSLNNNCSLVTKGRFLFSHTLPNGSIEYTMDLFQHDNTLVDSTVYVAGSGVDTATWDGYTIGQLFQAMKNMGFLA